MKLLCIVDKKGRIQHKRLEALRSYLHADMHIVDVKELCKPRKYDVVYYSHFSLYDKVPCDNKKLASVTSHKCLGDRKKTFKALRRFDAISVNNNILRKEIEPHVDRCFYTPNGVDIDHFCPGIPLSSCQHPPRLGWVGNIDRAIKNYDSILVPLQKRFGGPWVIVPTKKGTPSHKLKSARDMLAKYRSMDFYLVTSSAEGTPNPALEAMACGVPVITTRVGNMVDIVKDGENGYFVEDTVESFEDKIGSLLRISIEKYRDMATAARHEIESRWSWARQSVAWDKFLHA